jgi:tetratricopeptide (TPR) repeat protein
MMRIGKLTIRIPRFTSRFASAPAVGSCLVFAAVFIVYLATLAPTVTSADSGELITAMHRHGVAHPPGYPTWCILTGAVSDTLSHFWGDGGGGGLASPAYRSNLMSAAYGALAAAALFLVIYLVTGRIPPSAATALLAGFGEAHWSQSVITEVYSLDMLFFTLVLIFALRYLRDRRPTDIVVCVALYGLSLGNHWPLSLLWGAPILLYTTFTAFRRPKQRPTLALVLSCIAALIICAAAPYAVMYHRAASNPGFSWLGPPNWERLVYHISRGQYAYIPSDPNVGWTDKAGYMGYFLGLLSRQYTPFPLALAPFGIAALYRRNRSLLAVIFLILLVNPVLLIAITQAKFSLQDAMGSSAFVLPVYASIAILVGCGLDFILHRLRRRAWLAAPLALMLPLAPLLTNFRINDMSDYRLARDFNTTLLESLDRDAIMFAESDYIAFPILYLTAVEKLRPDVILATPTIDFFGKTALDILATREKLSSIAEIRLREHDLPRNPSELAQYYIRNRIILSSKEKAKSMKLVVDAIAATLIENSGRSVYFASRNEIPFRDAPDPADPQRPFFNVLPFGLALKVGRDFNIGDIRSATVAAEVFTKKTKIRGIELPADRLDDMGRLIVSTFHMRRGEALLHNGDRSEAKRAFLVATDYADYNGGTLNNIASVAGEYGFLDVAESAFKRTIEIDPSQRSARLNLAMLYEYMAAQATGKRRDELERKKERQIRELEALGP